MFIKIVLICIVLPFIKALATECTDDKVTQIQGDEEPALLGSDQFCFFAYSSRAKTSNIQKFYPNAVRVGMARLPYHRLDFNYYLEDVKGSLPTIVADCGYEVWGAIYTIPIQDLQLVLSKGSLAGNKRVFRFVQKIIQTYSGGNLINLKCNAFQQIDLPEKLIYGLPLPEDRRPSSQTLNRMIDAFKDARLPPKYIEEISLLPTRDQNTVGNNLGENSQPNSVVVAPNSLTVAPDSTVVAQNP